MTKRAPSLRGRWRRLTLGSADRAWPQAARLVHSASLCARCCRRPAPSRPIRRSSALFERHAATFAGVLDAVDAHATALRGTEEPVRAVVVPLARRRRRLCAGARAQAAAHRRGRLGPFDPRAVARRWAASARSSPSTPRRAPISPACPACASCPRPCRRPRPTCSTVSVPATCCSSNSSHILMPGSDVDILFNRVLPRLPAGALVHIHDIFLPFDYPAIWGWRNYNEQQGVRAAAGDRRLPAVVLQRLGRATPGRSPGVVGGGPPAAAGRRHADEPLAGETLMFARLRQWLFESGGRSICRSASATPSAASRNSSEILIGWISSCWSPCCSSSTRPRPWRPAWCRRIIRSRPKSSSSTAPSGRPPGSRLSSRLAGVAALLLGDRRHGPADGADLSLPLQIRPDRRLLSQGADAFLRLPVHRSARAALRGALRHLHRPAAAAGWARADPLCVWAGRGGPPNRTHRFHRVHDSNALLVQAEIDKFSPSCSPPRCLRSPSRAPAICWCARSARAPRRATCRASSTLASRPASAPPPCRSRPAKASCATPPS